jgi:CHAD domain-containing protein
VTTGDAARIEVELKYRVLDDAAAARYLEGDAIGSFERASPVRTVQVDDRYVDTAEGDIARAGYAARLRTIAGATMVGLKALAQGSDTVGLHRREEIEGPAHRTDPPVLWPPSDARSVVMEIAGDAPLVELVTLRQTRRKRDLRQGSTVLELSVDEVEVIVRDTVADRFVELEVELVRGDDRRVTALRDHLAADDALQASDLSKLEAALATVRGHSASSPDVDEVESPTPSERPVGSPETSPEVPPLVVPKSPGVSADDHVAEAARKVLRFHLARMLAREAGTREGSDIEALHGMRVATRRQRAAWRVFGGAFRPRRTRRYRRGLREIAARLGAVRDLDVLLEAAEAYRSELPAAERRALEPLLASWRSHREDARVLLIRELDSDGYRRWLDDYRDFVRTEGAGVLPVGPVQPHRVRDTAASAIWAAYEGVRSYEPVLRWADVETLHDLRIAGKWLRYTLEFVREALGPDANPLIARVTALQDHLGLMNDADVSARMARTFLVERAGTISEAESSAIGRYLVSREREVERLRRTIGGPWRGLAGPSFRRGLGRVVAGL